MEFPDEQLKDLMDGTYQPEGIELAKTLGQAILAVKRLVDESEAKSRIQGEIIAASLKKITLSKDDVLHVKSPQVLGQVMLNNVYQGIKPFFPNNHIIVSDADSEIEISVIQQKPEPPEKAES